MLDDVFTTFDTTQSNLDDFVLKNKTFINMQFT